MTGQPAPIKPSFVKRTLKAAKDAGLIVASCDIGPDGSMHIAFKGDDAAVVANPLIHRLRQVKP